MRGLSVRELTAGYGRTPVLHSVDFRVAPGEVVALLGENGAGKTTLLRVVSGFLRPRAGEVVVDGVPARLAGPRDAAALGIGMVHQHFLLIPELSVAENVVLGREPGPGPLLDLAAARREVAACAERFGLDVAPDDRVGDLGVAARQRVELLKVLVRGARFLLLDEPTGLLSPAAVRDLFDLVRRLASEGCGVVLVTHRLPEVLAVCSRATVLRGGRVTGARDVAATDERELARLMVGEDLAPHTRGAAEAAAGAELLAAEGLEVAGRGGRPAVEGATLRLVAGEVAGLAGVAGSGQTELLEALAGVRGAARGTVRLGGRDVTRAGAAARRGAGLGYVPADRGEDGLVAGLTVAENLVLGARDDDPRVRRGLLDRDAVHEAAEFCVREHDVRPPDPDALAGALSGGNQQKVLLAREIDPSPAVLLAAEPARGLDFRATAAVRARLRAHAANGGAVLVASTDLAELLALCDRVLVMYGGRIVGEVRPGPDAEERLGLLMTGAEVCA